MKCRAASPPQVGESEAEKLRSASLPSHWRERRGQRARARPNSRAGPPLPTGEGARARPKSRVMSTLPTGKGEGEAGGSKSRVPRATPPSHWLAVGGGAEKPISASPPHAGEGESEKISRAPTPPCRRVWARLRRRERPPLPTGEWEEGESEDPSRGVDSRAHGRGRGRETAWRSSAPPSYWRDVGSAMVTVRAGLSGRTLKS